MPVDLELTAETLAYLATLAPKTRTKLYEEIGRQEWDKCASDVMYWLDPTRHVIPYVHTQDPKPLYGCKLCGDDLTYFFDRRIPHLVLRHKIVEDDIQNIEDYFLDLPTTRVFTLFPYIEPIVKAWLKEKIVFIEKSRDMMVTWLIVTLYTWDVLYHRNRENIFQSDDSTKTLDLVKRAYFIWDNQPSFLKNVHSAKFSAGQTRSGILQVQDLNSTILGFPQGAEQIRQFHPSGIFTDEAAFQVKAEEAFTSVKPAIQAGGRYSAVSSANPGWFYKCCRDLNNL